MVSKPFFITVKGVAIADCYVIQVTLGFLDRVVKYRITVGADAHTVFGFEDVGDFGLVSVPYS